MKGVGVVVVVVVAQIEVIVEVLVVIVVNSSRGRKWNRKRKLFYLSCNFKFIGWGVLAQYFVVSFISSVPFFF